MNTIAVRYVGRRPVYREGAYGSGIVFTQCETKLVPSDLANKLLRHTDVYVPGSASKDTTIASVPDSVKKTDEQNEEEIMQSLRDSIQTMDKDALETYARTQFKIDIDKRRGLDKLRQQVTQLIDQYGAV